MILALRVPEPYNVKPESVSLCNGLKKFQQCASLRSCIS